MPIVIQVFPDLDPAIIEVKAPTTEVTVQEFYQAVRQWEDDPASLSYRSLISGAGGEDLGGSTSVGYTFTMQNAKIKFEDRTTPLDDGSGRTCDATNSQGIQLYVDDADFVTSGVYAGAIVVNLTTSERATIIDVIDANTVRHFRLSGAGNQGWTSGDEYIILPNVICNITGGNLVAVDSNGDAIDPVYQSVGVNVIRSSASSGTVSQQSSIEYSSFNGGVTIDTTSSYTGTTFPVGTPQQPVNNTTDALAIAAARGLTKFFIKGNITLDSGTDFQEMIIEGESKTKSVITISDAADVSNCEFYHAEITGVLDGGNVLKDCLISTLSYVNGYIENCVLSFATITLGGSSEAHFLDCWSGAVGNDIPIIDMGGSGQGLGMRNYNGGIKLINKSGAEKVSIDLNSGQVVLDSTVTNGEIVIRGVGKLTDNSNGATVNAGDLLRRESITEITWDTIYIDTVNGSSGTSFPLGTAGNPVDNITDARTIADRQNISKYSIKGSVSLDQSYSNWEFLGAGSILNDSIALNGQTLSLCKFVDISISGSCTSSNIQCERCYLTNVSGIAGSLIDSAIIGTLTLGGVGSILGAQQLRGASLPTIIDINGANRIFQASLFGGTFQINNSQAGSVVQLGLRWMESVTLDASNTGGTAILTGNGNLTDNSSMSVTNTLYNVDGIADGVWTYER